MRRFFMISALLLLTSGCATITEDFGFKPEPQPAQVIKNENTECLTIAGPSTGKAVVAVYGFADKTGQRKPSERMANISTAVTQGAEVWLIKALQEVGGGKWFQVVERVGLENLTKERQIIRQSRASVGDERSLRPMLFAGVLVEGGIIGYDIFRDWSQYAISSRHRNNYYAYGERTIWRGIDKRFYNKNNYQYRYIDDVFQIF